MTGTQQKADVLTYTRMFLRRYHVLSNIIRQHHGLTPTSICNLSEGSACIIGTVQNKRSTKNGHVMLTIEDPTGTLRVLINASHPEFKETRNIVEDGCIGIIGDCRRDILFTERFYPPDVPEHPLRTGRGRIACLGDFHYGSRHFLHEEFANMLTWLKDSSIEHVIIAGDLVEGVGEYPGQEKDLDIKDIRVQYEKLAEMLSMLKGKTIWIIPGNHDATRIGEPQPPISSEYAARLSELPNVRLLPSPATVEIGGLRILIYHGFSIPYYADFLGGLEHTDEVLKLLLKNRHLAPTYTSNQCIPQDTDPLLIDEVPDVFITGHTHTATHLEYHGVTCINASCWIGETEYQQRRGIKPDPAKIFILDCATREAMIEDFTAVSRKE